MAEHEIQFEPDTFTERTHKEHEKEEAPSLWRLSTPVETGYGSASASERETWRTLSETLLRLEHGLGSMEERLQKQNNELFETVDEIGAKVKGIELRQARNGQEISRVWREMETSKAQETVVSPRLRDSKLVPTPRNLRLVAGIMNKTLQHKERRKLPMTSEKSGRPTDKKMKKTN